MCKEATGLPELWRRRPCMLQLLWEWGQLPNSLIQTVVRTVSWRKYGPVGRKHEIASCVRVTV